MSKARYARQRFRMLRPKHLLLNRQRLPVHRFCRLVLVLPVQGYRTSFIPASVLASYYASLSKYFLLTTDLVDGASRLPIIVLGSFGTPRRDPEEKLFLSRPVCFLMQLRELHKGGSLSIYPSHCARHGELALQAGRPLCASKPPTRHVRLTTRPTPCGRAGECRRTFLLLALVELADAP